MNFTVSPTKTIKYIWQITITAITHDYANIVHIYLINRQHTIGNKQAIVCYGLDKENMLLS